MWSLSEYEKTLTTGTMMAEGGLSRQHMVEFFRWESIKTAVELHNKKSGLCNALGE